MLTLTTFSESLNSFGQRLIDFSTPAQLSRVMGKEVSNGPKDK